MQIDFSQKIQRVTDVSGTEISAEEIWEDTEGNKHFTTELVSREMIMLGERRDISTTYMSKPGEEEEFDEDIS